MNLHMKSTKHIKMNRTSLINVLDLSIPDLCTLTYFVSQHFFKGLNRNAVKSEFWEKNVP